MYAARWEVELLFRELKGTYRIEQMPSANKHVSETLIYAALLSLATSRRIYRLLTPTPLDRFRMPLDRFATLLAVVRTRPARPAALWTRSRAPATPHRTLPTRPSQGP